MDVSKNIRAIRESKNLTQVDVAIRLGTERSNYARLENRGENLTLKQLDEIASALEVSIYDIIGLPKEAEVKGNQKDKIDALEEKLKDTEEILKEKRRNIKLYNSFIGWTRDYFELQFLVATFSTVRRLGIRDIDPKNMPDGEMSIDQLNLNEEELRIVGEAMLSYEAHDRVLNDFMIRSGFINKKWFIDAFKRVSRQRKEKVSLAEVRNWVDGVFEFLEEE